MQKGDLHQADICGMFLLIFFLTPLKNMQTKKKNTTGLVPLGIFFFPEAVVSFLGLAICLLLFSLGQLPGLGCNGSDWLFPTPPPQPPGLILLGGPCSPCPCLAGREEVLLLFLLLLIFPLCFSHQLPTAACNNSCWPLPAALVLWAAHLPFLPPPLHHCCG